MEENKDKKDKIVDVENRNYFIELEHFYIEQCLKYRTVIQNMLDDLCIIEYSCSYKRIKNKNITESADHAMNLARDVLSNTSILYEPK